MDRATAISHLQKFVKTFEAAQHFIEILEDVASADRDLKNFEARKKTLSKELTELEAKVSEAKATVDADIKKQKDRLPPVKGRIDQQISDLRKAARLEQQKLKAAQDEHAKGLKACEMQFKEQKAAKETVLADLTAKVEKAERALARIRKQVD